MAKGEVTRRGFLRSIGMGSAVGAVGLAAPAALSQEKPKQDLAFRFMCHCSRELVAKVPATNG